MKQKLLLVFGVIVILVGLVNDPAQYYSQLSYAIVLGVWCFAYALA